MMRIPNAQLSAVRGGTVAALAATAASIVAAADGTAAASPPWPLLWFAAATLAVALVVAAARRWPGHHVAHRVARAVADLEVGIAVFGADERLQTATKAFANFYPALADLLRPGVRYADLVRRHAELTDQSTQRLLLDAGSVRRHHRPVTRIVTAGGRQTLLSDHVAANGDLVLLRVDLSGQQMIDREMRRRLRRLDDLCHAAFRWTWRTDRKGRLLESQPSLPGASASPLAPFVGHHLLEALADADAETVGEQMEARQPIALAAARITRGAHELTCTLAATPVTDERDEFDGFFGALHAAVGTAATQAPGVQNPSDDDVPALIDPADAATSLRG